jgi:hypothetical protein
VSGAGVRREDGRERASEGTHAHLLQESRPCFSWNGAALAMKCVGVCVCVHASLISPSPPPLNAARADSSPCATRIISPWNFIICVGVRPRGGSWSWSCHTHTHVVVTVSVVRRYASACHMYSSEMAHTIVSMASQATTYLGEASSWIKPHILTGRCASCSRSSTRGCGGGCGRRRRLAKPRHLVLCVTRHVLDWLINPKIEIRDCAVGGRAFVVAAVVCTRVTGDPGIPTPYASLF